MSDINAERLLQHVEDICAVSPCFDPVEHYQYDHSKKLQKYLAASRARMAVLLEKFENIGYRGNVQQWSYYNHDCFNVIFRQGRVRDHETWFVAHHDYCAGKGAEDNATALSVMIELARQTADRGFPIAFASFDLEEWRIRGAWQYVRSRSRDYLRQRISALIDLECLGSGRDLLLVEQGGNVRSDPSLNDRIAHAADTLDIPLVAADCSLSYADHVPFAHCGIPVTQMASVDYRKLLECDNSPDHLSDLGLINHSANDLPENIASAHLVNTTQILREFVSQLRAT